MDTTFFYNNDGNVNSKRTQLNSNMYKTSYTNQPGRGGTTISGRNTIERYDNNGRLMCRGIRSGRRVTYFDKEHKLLNGIAQF